MYNLKDLLNPVSEADEEIVSSLLMFKNQPLPSPKLAKGPLPSPVSASTTATNNGMSFIDHILKQPSPAFGINPSNGTPQSRRSSRSQVIPAGVMPLQHQLLPAPTTKSPQYQPQQFPQQLPQYQPQQQPTVPPKTAGPREPKRFSSDEDLQDLNRRPRRRFEEIQRYYRCNHGNCAKAYGTLNHLNNHVVLQVRRHIHSR
jgi:hypothetical protein